MATYTIKRGDTLSGIARQNNTDVNTLMGLNPYITNANKIYAGKSLVLPDAQPSQPAQTTNTVAQPKVQTPSAGNNTNSTTNQLNNYASMADQLNRQASSINNSNLQVNSGVGQYLKTIGNQASNTLTPPKTTLELAQEYARGGVAEQAKSLFDPYDRVIERQKQALQGQRDLAESQINAQRDDVLQNYNANARQAYINSMLGRKQVEQQLSQAGLNTSGLVGSAYANVENAYGNNLANLQMARDNSINGINRQLNEARLQYDIQENQLLADIEEARIEWQKYQDQFAWQKYQDRIDNYLAFENLDYRKFIDNRDFEYNQLINNRDYNYNRYINDRDYEYNKAVDDRNFNYQQGRAKVEDDQWQKEYDLALKKANSSTSPSRSSRSSSGSSSSGSKTGNYSIPDDTPTVTQNAPQSNNTTNNTSNNELNEVQTNIYTNSTERILRFSRPNSLQRKTMLQDLVNRGVLTQGEADILLSAQ